MKLVTHIAVYVAFIVVSGCVGRTVYLENEQGVKLTCRVTTGSAMATGVLARDSYIDNCVEQYKAQGYKVTGED